MPHDAAGELETQYVADWSGRRRAYREAEHDEGERDAVVQAAFAGECEAQQVVVAGIVHLDVVGQHRIGRGEDRREQQRRPPAKLQDVDAEQREERNGRQHGEEAEAQRYGPELLEYAEPQTQADGEQGDQQRDFGDGSQQMRVGDDIEAQQVDAGRPEGVADREVEHGGANGQAPQRRRCHAHKHEHGADDEKPQCFVHEDPVGAGMQVTHARPAHQGRCGSKQGAASARNLCANDRIYNGIYSFNPPASGASDDPAGMSPAPRSSRRSYGSRPQ